MTPWIIGIVYISLSLNDNESYTEFIVEMSDVLRYYIKLGRSINLMTLTSL